MHSPIYYMSAELSHGVARRILNFRSCNGRTQEVSCAHRARWCSSNPRRAGMPWRNEEWGTLKGWHRSKGAPAPGVMPPALTKSDFLSAELLVRKSLLAP